MQIFTVVGARPQFIKAAAVSRVLAMRGIEEILVHTGQHYDERMSAVFFAELDLREADVNLGVGSGPHGAQTGAMLEGIERELLARGPDLVLSYGDTNSTLAAALAAAKLRIPAAHVEAGLRSHNRAMPEEINRIVADRLADLLLAPTSTAAANLMREGVRADWIHNVGDVMYDVALAQGQRAAAESRILENLRLELGRYVLATVHRAENTDDPKRLRAILEGLAGVAEEYQVVIPLHPRTRKMCSEHGGLSEPLARLRIINPVGYLDMVRLQQGAIVIATDSGGVQKEAFFHGVPCVTVRDETEWVELVELGWNRLCPPRTAVDVRDAVLNAVGTTGQPGRPYGDGNAASRIADLLVRLVSGERVGSSSTMGVTR